MKVVCAFPGEGSRHRNSQASSQGAGAEPGCGGGWRPRGGHVRVTWPGPGGLREQEEDGSEGCSDRGGQSGARPVPLAPLESLPGPLLWPAHPRTTPPTALLLPPVVPRMGPQEQPGVQGAGPSATPSLGPGVPSAVPFPISAEGQSVLEGPRREPVADVPAVSAARLPGASRNQGRRSA